MALECPLLCRAGHSKEFVRCAEDGPAEPLRVLQLLREECLDLLSHLRRAVATKRRFHPSRWKEDVAGLLNLTQQFERGSDESARVRFANGVPTRMSDCPE